MENDRFTLLLPSPDFSFQRERKREKDLRRFEGGKTSILSPFSPPRFSILSFHARASSRAEKRLWGLADRSALLGSN